MSYNPNIHHRRSIRLKGYDYSQSGLYFITICCQDRICRFGKIESGAMILNEYGQIAFDEWTKLPERYPNMLLDAFQIMPNHIHGIIVLNDATEMAVAPNNGTDPTVGATLAVALNNKTPENNGTPADNDRAPADNDGATADNDGATAENNETTADNDGATARVAPTGTAGAATAAVPTVGDIVGAYKSLVTDKCLEIYKLHGKYMGKLLQRDYWERIIRNKQSYQRIVNYIVNNPKNWGNDKFYTK